jgi:hypothetical protein
LAKAGHKKYHWANVSVGKEEGQLNHKMESEKEMEN